MDPFSIFDWAVVIIFLVITSNLRGRISKLEQLLKGQVIEVEQVPQEMAVNPLPSPVTVSTSFVPPQVIKTPEGPTLSEKLGAWLKEDWLLKLGAALLIIGFGWFTNYAFVNNWVGPVGRVTLGLIAGALFLILGWWRIRSFVYQGGIFLALGSTIILITVYAARVVLDLFDPASALGIMFLSTAFVALASVKYKNSSLALVSLILAGIAPLLTGAPSADYISLFAYLFVVVLGTLAIVAALGKRELTTAALLLVFFYSLPHLMGFSSPDKDVLLLFAYAFATLFFITNAIGIVKLKGKEIIPDLITAAGNGMFLLWWILAVVPKELQSLIISAWMVVFLIGAFLLFRFSQRREVFFVYAGVAIAMLAAATTAELDGAVLTIAVTIECGIISLITYMVIRNVLSAQKINLLLLVPISFSFQSLTSSAWETGILHADFFVLLILGFTLLILALFFAGRISNTSQKEERDWNMALFIGGSLYVYALLWLSLHYIFAVDSFIAVMVSLVIYTVIGLICYFGGLSQGKNGMRLYGGFLVGAVVLRLLFVDVWNMELIGRTITFFIVGTLLVSTAFIGRKKPPISPVKIS
jgi:uncharacterized membrane protein